MSRCFPFPPPGYEKKPTTDDIDFLKKEKRKEKHKKDKKDREKREGKEKKDRSDGKHKEKKDKKDKHRDKKKDKENGKDKEKGKSNNLDEKRVDGQIESHNGETIHQNNEHNKPKDGSSGHKKSSVQFRNGEHRDQLLRKEESCKENCDKNSSVQLWGQNEKLLVQNRIKAEDLDNSKFVQEFGRRIRDEEKGTSSLQFPVESRKVNFDRGEIPKMDGQGITNEATFGRMVMVQNMINGTMPPLDKWADKRDEDKEKMREKEDGKRGDKRKNKDREKRKQGKDKDTDKDRTKEEKVKKKSELTKAERDKNKSLKNSDTIGIQRAGSELTKRKDMETNGFSHENEPRPNKMARPTSSILTENGRKQDFLQNPGLSLPGKQGPLMGSFKVDSKEQRVNGVIPPQPMTMVSKKPLIAASNHIMCKPTTTKLLPVSTDHVATQPLSVFTTKPPSLVPNHIETQPLPVPSTKPSSPLPVSSTKPSPVVAVANKVAVAAQPLPNSKKKPLAEAPMRPPHPDAKYLKQILTVPKLEQWSGLDDQEWLYSSKNDPHFKKITRDNASKDNKAVEVWSEAKHLESVDVCALPYVVPY